MCDTAGQWAASHMQFSWQQQKLECKYYCQSSAQSEIWLYLAYINDSKTHRLQKVLCKFLNTQTSASLLVTVLSTHPCSLHDVGLTVSYFPVRADKTYELLHSDVQKTYKGYFT